MKTSIDNEERKVLLHFYNKLKQIIVENVNSLEQDSLLLTLIKLSQNKNSRLLSESSISRFIFSKEIINALNTNNYIRPLDDIERANEFVITAFGIWFVETTEKDWTTNKLLQYFQDSKLTFDVQRKPLNDIEKIILLAMVSMRTFSESVPMDINDKSISDAWIKIFDDCLAFLLSMKKVRRKNWNTSRSGNEHPVSYVMRRANDLPQKTRHIYSNMGNNKYYLNIDTERRNRKINLKHTSEMIFSKIETYDQKDEIYTFMTDLAYDNNKNVGGDNKYINPEWDQVLQECLDDIYYDL